MKTCKGRITIINVSGDATYRIQPSSSQIAVNPDGSVTPQSITCKVYKKIGGTEEECYSSSVCLTYTLGDSDYEYWLYDAETGTFNLKPLAEYYGKYNYYTIKLYLCPQVSLTSYDIPVNNEQKNWLETYYVNYDQTVLFTENKSTINSAEFNNVAQDLKYVIGIELTQEEYDQLVESDQIDPKMRYYVIEKESDTPDTPDVPDVPENPDDTDTPGSTTITMDWAIYDNGTLIIPSGATYSNGTLIIG